MRLTSIDNEDLAFFSNVTDPRISLRVTLMILIMIIVVIYPVQLLVLFNGDISYYDTKSLHDSKTRRSLTAS